MEASERIIAILEKYGITATSFAKTIGIEQPQAIYDIKSGKTKTITERIASKIISSYPEISRSWLMSGEGDMFGKSAPILPISKEAMIPLFDYDNDGTIKSIIDGEIPPVDYLYIPRITTHGALRMPELPNILIRKSIYYLFDIVNINVDEIMWGGQFFLSYLEKRADGNDYPVTILTRIEKSSNPKTIRLDRTGFVLSNAKQQEEIDLDSIIALIQVKATLSVFIDTKPFSRR